MNNLRRTLLKVFRVIGDIRSVKNGTYGQRVARRTGRRTTRSLVRKLFK